MRQEGSFASTLSRNEAADQSWRGRSLKHRKLQFPETHFFLIKRRRRNIQMHTPTCLQQSSLLPDQGECQEFRPEGAVSISSRVLSSSHARARVMGPRGNSCTGSQGGSTPPQAYGGAYYSGRKESQLFGSGTSTEVLSCPGTK